MAGCQCQSSGVAFGAAADPPAVVEEPAITLEPFVEDIAGTALSFEMVPVPPGRIEFSVGEETFSEDIGPLWVARTETTWDIHDVFVFQLDEGHSNPEADAVTRPSKPYVSPDRGFGHNGYAAISLSYQNADHFCQWLSAKTGRTYRLPTEAEWRYICQQAAIDVAEMEDYAWFEDNADWTPHPVGEKKADALGLYDVYGNVREWATGVDGKPVAMGGSFEDTRDRVGCAGRETPTRDWQMTDPQIPKSPWWLSDAPFMGMRVICIPDEASEDK